MGDRVKHASSASAASHVAFSRCQVKHKELMKFTGELLGPVFDHSSWEKKLKPRSYYKSFSVSMRTTWKEYGAKKRDLEFRENDLK